MDCENTDSKDIFFSIGGHPAFNLPFMSKMIFLNTTLNLKVEMM